MESNPLGLLQPMNGITRPMLSTPANNERSRIESPGVSAPLNHGNHGQRNQLRFESAGSPSAAVRTRIEISAKLVRARASRANRGNDNDWLAASIRSTTKTA